ncbi:MAG: hypothetical protein IJY50_01280 [Clostridia bacterium]|nr:hypothetical protein [Clostridia bacterium]
MRLIQSLNGWWDYRIGRGEFTRKKVPFSTLPVGKSQCVLQFSAQKHPHHPRAFLVFDGITYEGKVTLNGVELGTMLAYSEYRFEVTHLLKEENVLSVELSDIDPVFGPSEGWENYGGIIRDVYLEYTGSRVITSTLWNGALNADYSVADCSFAVTTEGGEGTLEAMLTDKEGNVVATATADGDTLRFAVSEPHLWSPDDPYLYTLRYAAYADGAVSDGGEIKVGFKDFRLVGKRFYLNGKATFLLGINRHDIWGEQGHTMTEEQMRRDLTMIKNTGINYVRLVHYPHHKRIIELADELGLLVSEEPGLWWSDMSNQKLCDDALEVMRRTVLRDRNHVSIAFWLSFNECIFTLDYLKSSARVCRENDPYHMVSGANCMSIEMTKENFPICGFDFYTMHPYDSTPKRMIKSIEELTEMPLLFTEWGGYYCHDNPQNFRWFIDTIVKYWKNPDDQPVLAGACYWFWSEMYEFDRTAPACTNGVLREALVDAERNPLPDYDIFRTAFAELYNPEKDPEWHVDACKIPTNGYKNYETVSVFGLQDEKQRAAAWETMIAESKVPIARFHHVNKGNRKMTNGPVLRQEIGALGSLPMALEQKPYVITDTLTVPVGQAVKGLWVIGNVSMPKGYPISGDYGEDAVEYTVEYTDGSTDRFMMKNGEDVTTATGLHGPSRIEPYAANSPRAMRFRHQMAWEHYVVNARYLAADPTKTVRALVLRNAGNGYLPLFYGLTVEKA